MHAVTQSALSALCAPSTVKECIWVLAATGGLLHTGMWNNALASTSLCCSYLAIKLAELKLFLHSKTEMSMSVKNSAEILEKTPSELDLIPLLN